MGLAARVKQLEGDGSELCEQRLCMRLTTTEVIHHPDGTEERLGKEPPPLCERCPYREGGGPIRHMEVHLRYQKFSCPQGTHRVSPTLERLEVAMKKPMTEISKEKARQQDWVACTSPRVDRDLIGTMSDERLIANLDAAYHAALKQYGSEGALRRALRAGVVVESYLKYKEERYIVQAVHNPIVDKPSMMVMHLDEALAQGITDTYWDSLYDEQPRS